VRSNRNADFSDPAWITESLGKPRTLPEDEMPVAPPRRRDAFADVLESARQEPKDSAGDFLERSNSGCIRLEYCSAALRSSNLSRMSDRGLLGVVADRVRSQFDDPCPLVIVHAVDILNRAFYLVVVFPNHQIERTVKSLRSRTY
jgi:hypothetical protein